ncbi:MAG TPA: hypothetical protein VKG80_05355, partial [Trebonia sp.]|nr:hypothetical protein [Trebonia sp.]
LQLSATWTGVGVIAVLLAGNLRGVRQAGALFAAPTYAFIAAIAALVIAGLVHGAGRGFHPGEIGYAYWTRRVSRHHVPRRGRKRRNRRRTGQPRR